MPNIFKAMKKFMQSCHMEVSEKNLHNLALLFSIILFSLGIANRATRMSQLSRDFDVNACNDVFPISECGSYVYNQTIRGVDICFDDCRDFVTARGHLFFLSLCDALLCTPALAYSVSVIYSNLSKKLCASPAQRKPTFFIDGKTTRVDIKSSTDQGDAADAKREFAEDKSNLLPSIAQLRGDVTGYRELSSGESSERSRRSPCGSCIIL